VYRRRRHDDVGLDRRPAEDRADRAGVRGAHLPPGASPPRRHASGSRAITSEIVAGGGRPSSPRRRRHVQRGAGGLPRRRCRAADRQLAFLRKGSADLIGKRLGISNELAAAVEAIVEGIELDRCIDADVLAVEATTPDGRPERRHLVGFGGFEVFGAVPRSPSPG